MTVRCACINSMDSATDKRELRGDPFLFQNTWIYIFSKFTPKIKSNALERE